MTQHRRLLLPVAAIAIALLGAAPPPTSISITPITGDKDEGYKVGEMVTLDVTGVEDISQIRVLALPPTCSIKPIKANTGAPIGPWVGWGESPQLEFTAQAQGQYYILAEVKGSELYTMFTLDVTGPRPPPTLIVEPDTGYTASGNSGGPFTPPLASYTITASEDWDASVDQTWVSLLKTTDALKVVLGPEAYLLEAGDYTASVTVTCGELVQTRTVALTVKEKGSPEPEPGPGPSPTPTPSKLHVLILYEQNDLDDYEQRVKGSSDFLTSPDLQSYLESHCVLEDGKPDFKILDWDVDGSKMPDGWPAIIARGKESALKANYVPWIVIANESSQSFEGKLPDSVDGILDLLKKYGGE